MDIMSLADHVNEVHRKIGRNMMLFQEFEYLLKFILANGSFSGFISELKAIKTEKAARINKQTMGQLVGQYVENTHPDFEYKSDAPEELKEPHFSFNFQIECDPSNYEAKKEALAEIVLERNELVHHLLPSFDAASVQSCEDVGKKLDEQSEKIRQEICEMKLILESFREGRKALVDFLASEESTAYFRLNILQQSKLVALLSEISVKKQRSDGWTVMEVARRLVIQEAPEELGRLKEKYGHKTLKSLILASEMFDVNEEATAKGGARVLYRLKSSM